MQEKSSQSALAHPLLDTQQVILAHSSLIDESQFMQVTGGFMKSPQKAALVLFTLHVRPPPKNLLSRRRQFVPPLNQEGPLQASSKCPIHFPLCYPVHFSQSRRGKTSGYLDSLPAMLSCCQVFPFPGKAIRLTLYSGLMHTGNRVSFLPSSRGGRQADAAISPYTFPVILCLRTLNKNSGAETKVRCQSRRGSCNSLGSHSRPCSRNHGLDRFTLPA